MLSEEASKTMKKREEPHKARSHKRVPDRQPKLYSALPGQLGALCQCQGRYYLHCKYDELHKKDLETFLLFMVEQRHSDAFTDFCPAVPETHTFTKMGRAKNGARET